MTQYSVFDMKLPDERVKMPLVNLSKNPRKKGEADNPPIISVVCIEIIHN